MGLLEPKIAQISYPFAEKISNQILCHWTLNREGRDVRLFHHYVEAFLERYRPAPQQHVAIRKREPVTLVVQLHEDGIVEKPPLMVTHRNVLPLANDHVC